MAEKRCVLYDRECIECGECNLCDLDPTKICDNCGKCIGLNLGKDSPEYRAIRIDGIIDETMDPKEYLYDDEETLGSNDDDIMDDDDLFPFMRGNR